MRSICTKNPCLIGNLANPINLNDPETIEYAYLGSVGNGGRITNIAPSVVYNHCNIEADPGGKLQNFVFSIEGSAPNEYGQIKYIGEKQLVSIVSFIIIRLVTGIYIIFHNLSISQTPGAIEIPRSWIVASDLIDNISDKILRIKTMIYLQKNDLITPIVATTHTGFLQAYIVAWGFNIVEIPAIIQ
jgi:hypothetical protein